MSDGNGTCEYVLDPDDPETWGGNRGDVCVISDDHLDRRGKWDCPHDAKRNEKFCIFHRPTEEKDDKKVIERFINAIETAAKNTDSKKSQFYGAEFGDFILESHTSNKGRFYGANSGETSLKRTIPKFRIKDVGVFFCHSKFKGLLSWPVSELGLNYLDFSASKFEDEVDFYSADLECQTRFYNTVFYDDAEFFNVDFQQGVEFRHSEFKKEARFRSSEFIEETRFDYVYFDEGLNIREAKFGDDIYFKQSIFARETKFRKSKFFGDAYFADAIFENDVDWVKTVYNSNVNFYRVEFKGEVDFSGATFCGTSRYQEVDFSKSADFSGSEFRGKIKFSNSKFSENANFLKTEYEGNADFSGCEFKNGGKFTNLNMRGVDFESSDLTGCHFDNTNLRTANFESSILSRATLSNADLRGAKISGAIVGDVQIDENTQFLGHPSDDSGSSPHTLPIIGSRPSCVYDPNYGVNNEQENVGKAKSVYRALEELGRKHARPRLQARSFVQRKDIQKQAYWDDTTAGEVSLQERFIAGARWSQARAARATLLYGESPWRVITWSLGIIFSFALLYPLGGWMKAEGASEPLSYSQIPVSFLSEPLGWLGGFLDVLADSLYYSTLTYTALGFGDFQPAGLGRLLTTLETGFGAVMLALLVFILGRRAAR